MEYKNAHSGWKARSWKIISKYSVSALSVSSLTNGYEIYLQKAKLLPGKELREILFRLKETDRESFEYWIAQWHEEWKNFLSEKTENIYTGKKVFTHQRIRQAYTSIIRTMPSIFTFHQFFPYETYDSTTNSLDGYFSHLKAKLAVHRGASKSTQLKLISSLIFS